MPRPTKSSTPIPCWGCRRPATRTRSAGHGSRCARPVRPRGPCWWRRRPSAGMSIRRPAARERGEVVHAPTGRRIAYGELAADAARMPVPDKRRRSSEPKDFKLIGTPAKRLDLPAKVNGTAVFGIDARPPGVKIATLAQSPVFGGRVKSVDDTAAKAVKGVRQIVRLDDAVAVVADHMGAAKKGLEALVIEWDDGPHAGLSTEDDPARARTGDAQAGRRGAEHRRCRQRDGGCRHQGRGDLPRSVPRACGDGADELHGSCSQRRGAKSGSAPRRSRGPRRPRRRLPACRWKRSIVHNHLIGGGFGRRLEWTASPARSRSPSMSRVRSRSYGRARKTSSTTCTGRCSSIDCPRASMQGNAGRLEQPLCRILGDCAMAAARLQRRARPRHDRRRHRPGLRPPEPARRICAGGAAGHSDRVLAQRRSLAQCVRHRKLHG